MCSAFQLHYRRTLLLLENRHAYAFVRGCSNEKSPQKTTKPTPKLSSNTVRQNVKGYLFTRLIDYVQNYDKVLEKNFPSAVKVYRVFFDGVKDFYGDMKRYLKITRILTSSPKGLKALNRQELELYMQMPRDMFKVAPTIILSSLPLVGYAVFPLAYMYPRTFLTSHFWTLQQKVKFNELALTERLRNNRDVFRCLQAILKITSKQELHAIIKNTLGLLGSGFHPTVDLLSEVKDVFIKPPYNFESLSSRHIKKLCLIHGLKSGWFFNRNRLVEHAYVLHNMDRAIRREGGAHNLPLEAMKHSCYIRGLSPTNLATEEMSEWLQKWIQISLSLEENHMSFYLHLPVFLGYNHPNNWLLVYGNEKTK